MISPSGKALPDFLDQPAIAIRIAKRHESVVVLMLWMYAGDFPSRTKMERFADIHTATDKFSARGFDVVRDQVQAL